MVVKKSYGGCLLHCTESKEKSFDDTFDAKFPRPPVSKGADKSEVRASREVAKAALSNLLGSMGYFYGSSQVRIL